MILEHVFNPKWRELFTPAPSPPFIVLSGFGVSISISVDFQSQFISELWLQMRKEVVLILNERKVYSQICMKPALGLLSDFLFFVCFICRVWGRL